MSTATLTRKPSPRPRTVSREPQPRRPAGPLRRVLAAAVVVSLLGGAAVLVGLRLHGASAIEDARASAVDAGRRYATSIATYDFRDSAANLNGVVATSTEKFAAEYRESSTQLMQLITQYQATSQGTVLDAAATEVTADRAVVLAFVDQTIRNTNLKEPRVDRSRMRLVLLRSGDEWRLDEITLL
ncbi:hypothetical protein [Amycolatopsis suaedae]|uniref:Mce-associated membrane protein n=1 Tax=Amycolatopsis suaedae TaxID=2510978 RepID=A0A4Q7J842_9PSEU|nr:hypothetical protein [Amycolatopsis suaedae]RZQ63851.1 hypothetical protein EWH70_11880 [Amycolatopsis suaedae]